MSPEPALLILDDENAILDAYLMFLLPGGWKVGDAATRVPCLATGGRGDLGEARFLVARTGAEAVELVRREREAGREVAGGLFDLHLKGSMQGDAAMRAVRELQPGMPCTVVTGSQGELGAVTAVFAPDHLDEWDFLAKPFTPQEVRQKCRQMLATWTRRRREKEHVATIEALNRELELWGRTLETRVEQRTEQLATAIRELQRANGDLERALEQLSVTQGELVQREKMASLGQLAAGVARELSRPVAFATASLADGQRSLGVLAEFVMRIETLAAPRPAAHPSELALRTALGDALRDGRAAAGERAAGTALLQVRDALERVGGIVSGLLAFARPGGEQPRAIDVNVGLSSVADLVRGSLEAGEEVSIALDEVAPVLGHAAELQQVWLHLLHNAVEAVSQRHGDARIEVVSRTDGSDVIIEVRDNGEGMSPEMRDHVFEPFYSTRPKRCGLGLSIAHGIVQGHGGCIQVESEPGNGSTFRVRLPAAWTTLRSAG